MRLINSKLVICAAYKTMELNGSITSPLTESDTGIVKRAVSSSVKESCLLTPDTFVDTGYSLLHFVSKNQSVKLWLRVTGVLWDTHDSFLPTTVCQYVWNVLIRLGLLSVIVYSLILWAAIHGLNTELGCFYFLWALTIFLQGLTLGFSLLNIHKRLKSNVIAHTVLHLNKGLSAAYLVLSLSVCIALVPAYYYVIDTTFAWFYTFTYFIGGLATCSILAATMYFISTDCAVSISFLEQLMEQQRLELLTFEQYTLVRDEIQKCQSASQWVNNCLVGMSLLDIVTVLLYLLATSQKEDVAFLMTVFSVLLKDIPFLIVVYWQVAQVNEKYASFMRSLGATQWSIESNADNRRMAIYIKAQSNPIVMSLAGMKLKRRDIAWQFVVWCFATAVGVVKATVINKI